MAEALTRADYDYILEALIYARYAHEETHYATACLKQQQMACLDRMEAKLKALRDALEPEAKPKVHAELF